MRKIRSFFFASRQPAFRASPISSSHLARGVHSFLFPFLLIRKTRTFPSGRRGDPGRLTIFLCICPVLAFSPTDVLLKPYAFPPKEALSPPPAEENTLEDERIRHFRRHVDPLPFARGPLPLYRRCSRLSSGGGNILSPAHVGGSFVSFPRESNSGERTGDVFPLFVERPPPWQSFAVLSSCLCMAAVSPAFFLGELSCSSPSHGKPLSPFFVPRWARYFFLSPFAASLYSPRKRWALLPFGHAFRVIFSPPRRRTRPLR